ncbi:hypothetical protein [Polaromonas sp.]|uniref:hypothetical protein n=1 Tax=Polaromonas sp. TaxID=1869339 RepID=UPI00326580C0
MPTEITPIDDEQIINDLGGPSEVARLCETSPQAVSQWYGLHPKTKEPRHIPNSRLMFLKLVRPNVFAGYEQATPAEQPASTAAAAAPIKLLSPQSPRKLIAKES